MKSTYAETSIGSAGTVGFSQRSSLAASCSMLNDFVSIGLETRLTDLIGQGEGRPAAAFVIAQAFNVIWTLLLAWLLFGGIICPAPDIR